MLATGQLRCGSTGQVALWLIDTKDIHVLLQPTVVPPQHRELGALSSGQPAAALPTVPLGLLDPLPHRGLSQIEVPGDLPNERSPR